MVAISGAGGFIGSHLSALLPSPIKIPRECVGNFIEILTELSLGLSTKTDTIIHCASYGNHSFQTNEDTIFSVNVDYTHDLLEAAKMIGADNFIYFSSSSELGRKDEPMYEDMVARPETLYGATKACGTQLTRYYAKYFNTVVVRPFSVTGVGEQEKHLIPTLIRSCLYGEKIQFVPEPVHDFIDIDDLCRGVLLILKNIKSISGEIFHLGCGEQYSNQEVLEIVEKETRKKANTKIVDSLRSYDSSFWVADNSKLKSLGWRQTKTLKRSIKEMVRYESEKKNN